LSPISKLVLQVVSLSLLAVGIGLIAYARRTDPLDHLPPEMVEVESEASVYTQSAAERLSEAGFVGVVLAAKSVDLAPKVNGRVESIQVRVGERVGAGALIAIMDPAIVRQELAQGEAKLRAAMAEEAKAGAELEQAKENVATLAQLVRRGHASAKELQVATFQRHASAAARNAAHARVSESQAQVEQLKESQAETQIKAPFPGVISERYADPGAIVGPTSPIVRLISAGELRVRFAIPEELAGTVGKGTTIRVEVGAVRAALKGVVENIAPEIDSASRYLLAEARLESPEAMKETIPSGLVARVSVVTPVITNAK
jgi:RND family efflux transporter MFP subunit